MSNWNQNIIEEFRANAGQVGGFFAGKPLLLLHHIGAKTETERISPLAYLALDNGYAVFASAAGSDKNPDWFHNLKAHPDVKIEVGTDTVAVHARVAGGAEHDRIWEAQTQVWPQFADYEKKTKRDVIPIVVLEPAN